MKNKFAICVLTFVVTITLNAQDYGYAIELYEKKNYHEAAIIFEDLLNNDLENLSVDTIYDLAKLELFAGVSCYEIGLFNRAEEHFARANIMLENEKRTEELIYRVLINNFGRLYYYRGDYQLAGSFYLWVLEMNENSLEKVDTNFLVNLNLNIGMCSLNIGMYKEAENYLLKAKTLEEHFTNEQEKNNLRIVNSLGILEKERGNYTEALEMFYQAISMINFKDYKEYNDFLSINANIASVYVMLSNYENAIICLNESFTIYELYSMNYDEVYLNLLKTKAQLNQELGNYKEAFINYTELMKLADSILGTEHPTYSLALAELANLYYLTGQYGDALDAYLKSLGIIGETLGTNHYLYGVLCGNLSLLFTDIEEYEWALKYSEKAKGIIEIKLGVNNIEYITQLNNTALIHYNAGNEDTALVIYKEVLELIEANGLDEHAIYAKLLVNMGYAHKRRNEFDLALDFFYKAVNNMERIFGNIQYKQADVLINIGSILMALEKHSEAIDYIIRWVELRSEFINSNLYFMSSVDRSNFLSVFEYELEIAQSILLDLSRNNVTGVAGLTFNNQLLNKGLSLLIDINLRDNILFFGTEDDLTLYENWLGLKQKVFALSEQTLVNRSLEYDSLINEAKALERELLARSSKYKILVNKLDINWMDIQKHFNSSEIALEFSTFQYHNGQRWTDSTYYVALVLGKDYKHPKMIKLFEERELRALMPDATQSSSQDFNLAYQGSRGSGVAYYGQSNSTGDQLYELIWKPLDSLIEGINTVYYANSGLLHKVNLAALPAPDGKLLLERFQLNQLSSTRNLVLKEEEKPMSNAVVYGGIHYDMQQEQLANAVASVSTDTLEYEWLGATISYPELRGYAGKYGGFNYLPGSLYEAQQVAYHLEEAMETRLITGDKAVEESFTQLSGNSSPSVIHIATHGFYFPDTITQVTDRDMLLMGAMGEERFRIYDDPLLRSALVMAGANRSWLGEELPPGAEDGILTAKDVSAMNLSNTELVVLSACQTGLGEVDGTEGVTGLQRGFKIAGVKYVMMSLWPVPDKETAEFMETFYSYWGEGIREAFHKTQQFMANKYRNEPYKWAGFVLVE